MTAVKRSRGPAYSLHLHWCKLRCEWAPWGFHALEGQGRERLAQCETLRLQQKSGGERQYLPGERYPWGSSGRQCCSSPFSTPFIWSYLCGGLHFHKIYSALHKRLHFLSTFSIPHPRASQYLLSGKKLQVHHCTSPLSAELRSKISCSPRCVFTLLAKPFAFVYGIGSSQHGWASVKEARFLCWWLAFRGEASGLAVVK